jgi:hypothetical protein
MKDFAEDIAEDLRDYGLKAFVDRTALRLGDQADQKIINTAAKVPIGLVLICKDFFGRSWCVKELRIFLEKKTLLPVLLGISYEDLEASMQERKVKEGLGKLCYRLLRTTAIGGNTVRPNFSLRRQICVSITRRFVKRVLRQESWSYSIMEGVCRCSRNISQRKHEIEKAIKASNNIISLYGNHRLKGVDPIHVKEAEGWVAVLHKL